MRRVTIGLLSCALFACSDANEEARVSDGGDVAVSGTLSPWVDAPMAAGMWRDVGHHVELFADGDVWTLRDPRLVAPVTIEGAPDITAAAWVDGEVYSASSDGVAVWRDGAFEAPFIDSLIDGSVRSLDALGDAVWVLGEQALVRGSKDTFTGLAIDGAVPTAFIAGSVSTFWARTDALHRLEVGLGGALVTETYGAWVDAPLIVTQGEQAWLIEGDGLLKRTGIRQWTRYGFPSPIDSAMGNRLGNALWIAAGGATWVAIGAEFFSVSGELPAGVWHGVDARGRLWIRDGETYTVASATRAVGIAGLSPHQRVTADAELAIDPVMPDDVVDVRAGVGDAVSLTGPPWRWRVAVGELGDGERELTVAVTWGDGETAELSVPFVIGQEPIVWTTHIRPLYDAHCAACHIAGGTSFDLSTSELWKTNIDGIVAEVSSGEMPLEGDPLSPSQQALIEAWMTGGFAQ